MLVGSHNKDPKQFWKLVSGTKDRNTFPVIDPNLFFNYFSILNKSANADRSPSSYQATAYIPLLDDDITLEETRQAIIKSKANKAPGIDGISINVLKAMNGPFLICLTALFNNILRSGTYPKSW